MKSKMIIVMILLIVSMQNVFGLGIAPASKDLYFEPLKEEEVMIIVMNTQNMNMSVIVSKEGEMSEYVSFDEEIIRFDANEDRKYFTVKVKMPEELESGTHEAEIVVTEIPEQAEGVNVIVAKLAVGGKIKIIVPYIGKYAKAQLELSDLDDKVGIYIPISNIGTEDIVARARIRIFYGDEELDVIETDSLEVKSLEKGWINEEWNAPSIGLYKVLVDVYYDDKVIWLEGKFDVGEMFIEVEDVLFDKVKLKEVAGFDIVAKSNWNDVIKDIYADVLVKNKQGYTVDELKTASSDIGAFSEEKLRAYWDTEGISEGVYDFVVRVNYEGRIAEKMVEVNVEKDVIDLVKVEEVKPFGDRIIVGAVLVIVLLVIVVFYLWRKRLAK